MIILSKTSLEKTAKRRPPGYLSDVLSRATVDGDRVELSPENYHALVAKYRSPPASGPGAELKKLLSKIGITSSPSCSCNNRAKTMDEKGIQWCEENVETICDWLQEEAAKRKLPFVRLAGKAIINLAIRRAKKNISK